MATARQPDVPAVQVDPTAGAAVAACRYVDDRGPGIRRIATKTGFRYRRPDGKPVGKDDLRRIKALVIPPAWTDVWICPLAHGHIQATGRDARGRKQYRYHAKFREVREETKYGRMIAFAEALPKLRAAVDRDLARKRLERELVLATIVRLLEITLIRIGNEEYARENGSFGLTTLTSRHVDIEGSRIHFRFRGKSGKDHSIDVRDRRLARIVARCHDLPGEQLFQYSDEDGALCTVESSDVNAYLKEISGTDFTAKDFRTWAGTVLAALTLVALPHSSVTEAKRNLAVAIKDVAQKLGNTPAVCKRCYVHPRIFESYHAGELATKLASPPPSSTPLTELGSFERAVFRLLRSELDLAGPLQRSLAQAKARSRKQPARRPSKHAKRAA